MFKFQLCGANGTRKATYVGYQMSYDALMPSQGSEHNNQMWKAIRRELAAADILSSDYVVNPEEFVKTKHHCYIVKEYANGGSLAQLLLYRS